MAVASLTKRNLIQINKVFYVSLGLLSAVVYERGDMASPEILVIDGKEKSKWQSKSLSGRSPM